MTFRDATKTRELTFHVIYALDGDVLTICINRDGTSDEKPSAFTTKKGQPFCLVTFFRAP
jgi:uncharacterized protein (TIGR03067 family)